MCFFANVKGVCDTPLHLFDYFMGITMVKRGDFALGAAQKQNPGHGDGPDLGGWRRSLGVGRRGIRRRLMLLAA